VHTGAFGAPQLSSIMVTLHESHIASAGYERSI
jgi:hypothetical protein